MKLTKKIVLSGAMTLMFGTISHKASAQNDKYIIRDAAIAPCSVETSVIPHNMASKIKKVLEKPTQPYKSYTVTGNCVANITMDYAEYVKTTSTDGIVDSDAVVHGYKMCVMVYNIDTDYDGLADKVVQYPVQGYEASPKHDMRGNRLRLQVKEYNNRGGMPICNYVYIISPIRQIPINKGETYNFVADNENTYKLNGRIVAQNYTSVWGIAAADWGNNLVSYGGDIREYIYKVCYFVDLTGDGLSDAVLQYYKQISDKTLMNNLVGRNVSCSVQRASPDRYAYYKATPIYENDNPLESTDGTFYIYNYDKSALKNKISKTPYDPNCLMESFITPQIIQKRIIQDKHKQK